MTVTSHMVSDADFAAAFEAGRLENDSEIHAQSVRYLADRDVIEIVTSRQVGFLIPRSWVAALQGVPVEDLINLMVWPDGSAIELENRDIQISVDGLMTALLPAMLPPRKLAAMFASRGGKVISGMKRNAAQKNGLKGGRPSKARKTAA